ncbi:hypothetical protein FXO38_14261 [Capsicum annuum]|uniref:Pentatricopeptide repeat-containing protein n=1 Tax=Capsicum annuum TaxID=4072 RepID=A0A2G2YKB7_CAPAN|nr:hypothetical protein FXO38_14261 [Capsicum annuum]KAF3658335.1 hypothetical protein FXO37_14460 [Capsicum annuum]PHT70190.1 hypothetical protein T459_25294 [Capsicum annuum]
MVSVISAFVMSEALDLERWVHAFIDKRSIENDLELSTALVKMYANCGYVEKTVEVFEAMPFKDVKEWSSMIVGLIVNGLAEYALVIFSRMNEAKLADLVFKLVVVIFEVGIEFLISCELD